MVLPLLLRVKERLEDTAQEDRADGQAKSSRGQVDLRESRAPKPLRPNTFQLKKGKLDRGDMVKEP